MNQSHPATLVPWYRDRWPWLLMVGPFVVVIAGFFTLSLALQSTDGLVVDDYYKRGKEVNKSLARDDLASGLKLKATVTLNEQTDSVEVQLFSGAGWGSATGGVPAPKTLNLRFVHSTRSGYDRVVRVTSTPATNSQTGDAAQRFTGSVGSLASGRWHLILEDSAQTWRLTESIRVGQQSLLDIRMTPPLAADR